MHFSIYRINFNTLLLMAIACALMFPNFLLGQKGSNSLLSGTTIIIYVSQHDIILASDSKQTLGGMEQMRRLRSL